jgi:hypothetical protein
MTGRNRLEDMRRQDNIKTDVKDIEGVDWISLSQQGDTCPAVVNTVMNLKVAQNFGNLSCWGTISLLHGVGWLAGLLVS